MNILDELTADLSLTPRRRAPMDPGAALERRVGTLQQKVLDAGLDPSMTEPRQSLFSKVLDIIDTPLQAVSGVVDAAFFEEDLGDVGLWGAIKRGTSKDIDPFDLARKAEIENPLARAAVGFGASMLLDPLNLITGGTKGAAFAGGKALTKVGKEAVSESMEHLMKGSVKTLADGAGEVVQRAPMDFIEASNKVDDAFRAADRYRDLQKDLELAKKSGNTMLKEGLLKEFTDVTTKMEPLLNGTELSLKNIDDLFQAKGVKLSLDVPLLGHLQGKKSRKISKEAGVLAKGLTEAGNVLKPGNLSTPTITSKDINKALDSLGLGEPFKEVYKQTKEYGDASLKFLKAGLDRIENIPVLGAPVSVGKGAASGVKKALDTTSKGFQSIFMRKHLTGAVWDKEKQLHLNRNAVNQDLATEAVEGLFHKELIDEAQRPLLREALIDIDAMAFSPIEELYKSGALEESGDKLLDNLNKMALGVDFEDVEFAKIPGLEDKFRQNLDAYLRNPEKPQELKDLVQRTLNHFDGLIEAERKAGIKVGFIESYIPHLYENTKEAVEKKGLFSGGSRDGWLKQRKYRTLKDAIEQRPLVPNLNLADIVHRRTEQSLRKIGEKNLFNRMTMEAGMDFDTYKELAIASKESPEILEVLQRRGFDPPKFLSEEALALRDEVVKKQSKTQGQIRDILAGDVKKGTRVFSAAEKRRFLEAEGGLVGEAAQHMEQFGDEVADALISPELKAARARAMSLEELQNFNTKAFQLSYEGNMRPKDYMDPDPLLGEVATMVTDNGKKIALPTPIARSFEETVARRDKLREIFADSEGWQNFVDLADAGLNFMKKTVTLPFPAYWGRNLIGDSMFRYMDGGLNALDPGLYPEVFNALKGKSGITLANGTVMDPSTFRRILKENGLRFGSDDYLDVIKAASDTDVERHLKKKAGLVKNITDPGIALEIASQNLRDGFENFFRISHLTHRIKNGDTIRDAVLRTNEALINYRDLNQFEQSFARRAWMFWGWTSKASKKAMTSLLTSPGDIKSQIHAARGVSELLMGSEPVTIEDFDKRQLKSLVSQEQVSFPLGRDKDGKIITGRGFGLPFNALGENLGISIPRNMSLTELADTFLDSTSRTLQKQVAQANPALRIAAEQISGKNLFFDKPLDSKFLRKLPEFEKAAERIAPYPFTKIPARMLDEASKTFLQATPDGEGNMVANPGLFYIFTSILPGISRAVSTSRTLTREETPLLQNILGATTGIRVEGQDIDRSGLYEQQRNLQDVINRNNVDEILNQRNQ